jgi:hypothetical protein
VIVFEKSEVGKGGPAIGSQMFTKDEAQQGVTLWKRLRARTVFKFVGPPGVDLGGPFMSAGRIGGRHYVIQNPVLFTEFLIGRATDGKYRSNRLLDQGP